MARKKHGPPPQLIVINGKDSHPRDSLPFWEEVAYFGNLTLLFGMSNTGKSHITEYLLACAITGHPPPGESNHRDPVQAIYMSAEDNREDTTTPRIRVAVQQMLQAMGKPSTADAVDACMSRLHFVMSVKDADGTKGFRLLADVELLEAYIAECNARRPECPVGFLAVSPISAYSGIKDANDGNQNRELLTPLKEMCERTFCVGWLIGHPRKDSKQFTSSVADMHSGSQQLFNAMRVVMFTARSPETEPDGSKSLWTLLLREKTNIGDSSQPWGVRFQVAGTKFVGLVYPARGNTLRMAEKKTTMVAWGGRYDRTPDEVMRDLRHIEQAAEEDGKNAKGNKTPDAKLAVICYLLTSPSHTRTAQQMERLRVDKDIADFSWRNARKQLLHDNWLVVEGSTNNSTWRLGDGISPLDKGGQADAARAPTTAADTANGPSVPHGPAIGPNMGESEGPTGFDPNDSYELVP